MVSASASETEPSPLSQEMDILLVEDEVLNRWLFAEELRAAGFRVIEAGSADEAWAYLMTGGKADLVFSDIVMPGDMDGRELCKRLNDKFPAIKIVLTSGNSGPMSDVKYERFLQKPYHFDHAIWIIRKALRT
ncbi:MAG TPA: response regulator [Terriglobia bacterium]|nr:response regulator [Terriglobia bacterium]